MGLLWKCLILATLGCLTLSGCGVYSFSQRGKSSIETIAVLPFENQTEEYELSDRITEIIVDQFIADGNLKVVPQGSADALLEGTLVRYKRVPHQFDENDQVTQYKVLMDFQITFSDPKEDKELWTARMNQEGIFDALEETEEDGQLRAGGLLVEAILNRTTKSW